MSALLSVIEGVCAPVDQPRLLGAGQRRAQLLRLGSHGRVLKLFPSKGPLSVAPCCYSVAVHGEAQVGMDATWVQQISRVICLR